MVGSAFANPVETSVEFPDFGVTASVFTASIQTSDGIVSAVLSRDFRIKSSELTMEAPAQTGISYTPGAHLVHIAKATSGSYVGKWARSDSVESVSFYPKGKVRILTSTDQSSTAIATSPRLEGKFTCSLAGFAGDIIVSDIVGREVRNLELFPDGQVKACALAFPATAVLQNAKKIKVSQFAMKAPGKFAWVLLRDGHLETRCQGRPGETYGMLGIYDLDDQEKIQEAWTDGFWPIQFESRNSSWEGESFQFEVRDCELRGYFSVAFGSDFRWDGKRAASFKYLNDANSADRFCKAVGFESWARGINTTKGLLAADEELVDLEDLHPIHGKRGMKIYTFNGRDAVDCAAYGKIMKQ